ncbi:MAG TPA: hypothetical protein VF736_09985 [Pyrinomonadaceae bacterium]
MQGDQNQTIQNTGTIQGGIVQRIQITQRTDEEVACYQTKLRGHLRLKQLMTTEAWWGGIATLSLSVLNVSGGLASVLSFFGLTAGQIFLTQGVSWLVAFVCGCFTYGTLSVLLGVVLKDRHRQGNSLFELTNGGTVRVSLTTADCPVAGCSGLLNLTRPKPNEEEITLAGVCTSKPSLHVFDYDERTQQGKRLFLTYKKEEKK